jgi:transposase
MTAPIPTLIRNCIGTSLTRRHAIMAMRPDQFLCNCWWAHLRRKFYELHISGVSQGATASVTAMSKLWEVEDEVRGKDGV